MENHKLLWRGVVLSGLQLLFFANAAGSADAKPVQTAAVKAAVVTPAAAMESAPSYAFENKYFVDTTSGLMKRRDSDVVSFLLAARFAHLEKNQIAALSKTLVDTAYAKFAADGVAHRYLRSVVPMVALEQKQKTYSLSLFDPSLAADLNRLCGPNFSKVNLKETKIQLRASLCYFEALSRASASYDTAAELMDHGQRLASLIQAKKKPAEAPAGSADLAADTVMPSAVPSDDLLAIESLFKVAGGDRYTASFNYALKRILAVNPSVSPMRQAVLSTSLAQVAMAVLQTDSEAAAFIDLIGSVSGFQMSTKGLGLGSLTVSLGDFAAGECSLPYSISEQDLDGDQSGLLLSACLFRGTLRRFGHDVQTAAAAYKALVARGQTTAELFGRPLVQEYSLEAWTEVTRPVPMATPEESSTALIKALAKIVHTPLQDTLRGETTFALLAKIAEAVYPNDEKGQQEWLIVLAMESKFDGGPTSETGARGIGQLIPTYAHDFGEGCNLTHVDKVDLADDATNALLSACYFKTLVKAHDGMVMLALAAYNAGLNSEDLSHFKHLSRMSNEPANYVARFALIKESLERVMPKDDKPALTFAATTTSFRIPMADVADPAVNR